MTSRICQGGTGICMFLGTRPEPDSAIQNCEPEKSSSVSGHRATSGKSASPCQTPTGDGDLARRGSTSGDMSQPRCPGSTPSHRLKSTQPSTASGDDSRLPQLPHYINQPGSYCGWKRGPEDPAVSRQMNEVAHLTHLVLTICSLESQGNDSPHRAPPFRRQWRCQIRDPAISHPPAVCPDRAIRVSGVSKESFGNEGGRMAGTELPLRSDPGSGMPIGALDDNRAPGRHRGHGFRCGRLSSRLPEKRWGVRADEFAARRHLNARGGIHHPPRRDGCVRAGLERGPPPTSGHTSPVTSSW